MNPFVRRFLVSGRLALVLSLAVLSHGCESISPLVRDFNIIPVEQEKTIGQKMQTEISRQMKVVQGTDMNRRVDSIGSELVSVLPNREFAYRFHVVEDASWNAFTIPGGDIYVHTGLISAANDAELAGVMAHEMGHVYRRHPAKALSRAYGLQYLAGLVLPENTGKAQQLALQFAAGGLLNSYSRQDETEADEVAYYLMKRTRYPPQALITFFQKLQNAEGRGIPTILSDHPATADRIRHLQDMISRGYSSSDTYGL